MTFMTVISVILGKKHPWKGHQGPVMHDYYG